MKAKTANRPEYAMECVMICASDAIASILTLPHGEHKLFATGAYEVRIEQANDGWDDVWSQVSVRYQGDKKWVNCGNRHGGRQTMARIMFADMKAMDARETVPKHNLHRMANPTL